MNAPFLTPQSTSVMLVSSKTGVGEADFILLPSLVTDMSAAQVLAFLRHTVAGPQAPLVIYITPV